MLALALFALALTIQMIASAALSVVGNDNDVSRAIPDWPDAWCIFLVGTFFLGVALLKFCAGCCPPSPKTDGGCKLCTVESFLCNGLFALIAAIVLLCFVVNGTRFLSPAAWDALRGSAVSRASGLPADANATRAISGLAADVLRASFLRPMIITLVILLTISLFVEYLLLVTLRERRDSLLRERGVQLAEGGQMSNAPAGAPAGAPGTALAAQDRTVASSI